jgi:hypothetical protein
MWHSTLLMLYCCWTRSVLVSGFTVVSPASTESLGRQYKSELFSTPPFNPLEETEPPPLESLRRRQVLSTLLAGTAATLSGEMAASAANVAYGQGSKLQWSQTPVNKRTGVTVFTAEQTYNVRFVTYLSRFLLCFDADCQRWWYSRASDIPRRATADQVYEYRLRQFAAFSASVEVGLQEYLGTDEQGMTGPATLLQSLLRRYGRRAATDTAPSREQARLERETKEARRQIALLFALMEQNQPVLEITKLLAAIDNGSVARVEIRDPGSGYAPGYGPPTVTFAAPDAGPDYVTATGRAVLRPNGKLLRLDPVNRGLGYQKPPLVTISPPAAIRFAKTDEDNDGEADPTNSAEYRQAKGQAFLFRSGVNKGRIERIQLVDPGAGYSPNEIIRVRVDPPELNAVDGGVTATATAILEYEVAAIQIVNNGTGYAVEKPIRINVEPPPLTARVNMNDPLMARIIDRDQPLPASTIPSKEMLKKMPNPNDPNSVAALVSREASRGGADGCIGRGCYDQPVVAVAYAQAELDSYTTFRSDEDASKAQQVEQALDIRSAATILPETATATTTKTRSRVSASGSASSGSINEASYAGGGFMNYGGGSVTSQSSQLLSLLPAGVGLEYNSEAKRYVLAVDTTFSSSSSSLIANLRLDSADRPVNPDFGPRGRYPIERDMELGASTYIRFVAAGAICCSGVHLALTPIDVVKTKVRC